MLALCDERDGKFRRSFHGCELQVDPVPDVPLEVLGHPAPANVVFEALDRAAMEGPSDHPVGVDGREAATRSANEEMDLPVLWEEGRGPERPP